MIRCAIEVDLWQVLGGEGATALKLPPIIDDLEKSLDKAAVLVLWMSAKSIHTWREEVGIWVVLLKNAERKCENINTASF